MRSILWTVSCWSFFVCSILWFSMNSHAELPQEKKVEPVATEKSEIKGETEEVERVSVKVARERAELTHSIYAATLEVIHHNYFRDDRARVPARAMEAIFTEIGRRKNVKARWISVNARAMSIDHRPRDEFERTAAKAIASGKRNYELVEDGVYRRAEGISLMDRGCLNCHLGFQATGKPARFAGLVISIPVTSK
jgi:hypothetical protein